MSPMTSFRLSVTVLAVMHALFAGFTALVGAFANGGDIWQRHCQLVEGSALLPREIDAPDRFQQAHVTASHSTNARVRSRRW